MSFYHVQRLAIGICKHGQHVFGCITRSDTQLTCEGCKQNGLPECTMLKWIDNLARAAKGDKILPKDAVVEEKVDACPACKKEASDLQSRLKEAGIVASASP
ncbi:hypothetical protein D4R52_02480 [bacterium]|nr:MAG: hypothetical protein D4R52_02480 [bacterium]